MPARLAVAMPRQPAAIVAALWKGCEMLTTPSARTTGATCYRVCILQCHFLSHAIIMDLGRTLFLLAACYT